jgi:hypothetical protein
LVSIVSVFGGVLYNDVYKGAITALYTLIYIRRMAIAIILILKLHVKANEELDTSCITAPSPLIPGFLPHILAVPTPKPAAGCSSRFVTRACSSLLSSGFGEVAV